jgi:hypothetical protein
LFAEEKAANFYRDQTRVYLFRNAELRVSRNSLSAVAAIVLAKLLGTTGFKFLCFDACMDGSLEYAESIGYSAAAAGAPERFLGHRRKMLSAAEDLPSEWLSVRYETPG